MCHPVDVFGYLATKVGVCNQVIEIVQKLVCSTSESEITMMFQFDTKVGKWISKLRV